MEFAFMTEPQAGGTYDDLVGLARWAEAVGFVSFSRSDHYLNMDESAPATDALTTLKRGTRLNVHGMARIAFDDQNLYVNGRYMTLPPDARPLIAGICATRRHSGRARRFKNGQVCLAWMLKMGAFEIPENL